MKTALATFGAGCFWGVEDEFRKVRGVLDAAVGYEGGTTEHPSYERVCTGRTGHAEVVQLTYDSAVVSYRALLETFWDLHDPTQVHPHTSGGVGVNRPPARPNAIGHSGGGPDMGSQYRSVIFFHTSEQERLARASKDALEKSGKYKRPLATEIVPAETFWRAEEYHQQYFKKNGGGTCPV